MTLIAAVASIPERISGRPHAELEEALSLAPLAAVAPPVQLVAPVAPPEAAPESTPHTPRPLIARPVLAPTDPNAWLTGRRYALAMADRPPKHLAGAGPSVPSYRPRHLATASVHRSGFDETRANRAS